MTNKNIYVCKDGFVFYFISVDVAQAMLCDEERIHEIDALSLEDESAVEIDSIEKLEEYSDDPIALAIGFRNELTASGKPISVYDSVEAIKQREQEELRATLRKCGEKADGGYEYHFEDDFLAVAAYYCDEPCDVIIIAARLDKYGNLIFIAEDKNDRSYQLQLRADDLFAGQLDFITSQIRL